MAAHSRAVGEMLRALAAARGEDAALWLVTGLCHDLDHCATAADQSQHGLIAAL
jgi:predicted hydrolase (HD superfamily)